MRSILALKQAGILCVLLITACQRELGTDDEPHHTPPTDTCKLSKIVYYDSSGAVDDTAGFTYTNNRISHVATSSYSMDLIYTNDRVTRINYFDQANAQYDFYDSVGYNSAGKIESLTFLSQLAAGGPTPTGGYQVSYNTDGTPAKLIERTIGPGGTLVDSYEYVYTWNNQNISSMTVRDLIMATDEPPVNFTYDSKSNYYHGFPAEFIFADNMLFGISGLQFGYTSPFMFSKNNIISINGAPVAYGKDDIGNFSSLTVGSFRPASYGYQCE